MIDNMITVDGNRLWQSLMKMAEIGATDKGGCNRQALTDLDAEGRQLFIGWCVQIGCEHRYDQMGNLFVRYPGTDDSLPPILIGSHLDTQPTGGKFDGVYGVLAGLEVIRTLHDNNIKLVHPIEVVAWTNEEGARFAPAMIGSGVWAGEFDVEYGWNCKDKENISIKNELISHGMLGDSPCESFPVKAAFELHIEQGPILEAEELQIGVVKGVQGIRWYDLVIHGNPSHAGPTPMEQRQDPVLGMTRICQELYQLIESYSPWARVTFGDVSVTPGSRNTVPESLTLSVDMRHPDQMILDKMHENFKSLATRICEANNLSYELNEIWHSTAVAFDENCINQIEQSVKDHGYPYRTMFSGAGHDSVYTSKVVPTAMIFIPCEKGLSHNEEENVTIEDVTAGCNVLLGAVLNVNENK